MYCSSFLLIVTLTGFFFFASSSDNVVETLLVRKNDILKEKVNSLLHKEYQALMESSLPPTKNFSFFSRHYKNWLRDLVRRDAHYSIYNQLSLKERANQKILTAAMKRNQSSDLDLLQLPSISSSSQLASNFANPGFSTKLYSYGVPIDQTQREYEYFWTPVNEHNFLSQSYHFFRMSWSVPSPQDLQCPRSLAQNSTHLAFSMSLTRCPNPDFSLRTISSSNISWKPKKTETPPVQTQNSTATSDESEEVQNEKEDKGAKENVNPFLVFALTLPPDEHPFSRRVLQMLRSIAPMFPEILFVNGMASEFQTVRKKYNINSLPKILLFKDGIFTGKVMAVSDVPSLIAELSSWSEMLPQSLPLLSPFPHRFLLEDNRIIDQHNQVRLQPTQSLPSDDQLGLPVFFNEKRFPIINSNHPKGKHFLIGYLSASPLLDALNYILAPYTSFNFGSMLRFFPYVFEFYFLPVLSNHLSYEEYFVSFRLSKLQVDRDPETHVSQLEISPSDYHPHLIFHYELPFLLLLPFPNLEPFISSGSYYYYLDRVTFLFSGFFLLFAGIHFCLGKR